MSYSSPYAPDNSPSMAPTTALPTYRLGYPSEAAFIASSPDLAILRRFGNLNARNLLYLQTELTVLESDLVSLDDKAIQEGDTDWRRSWESVLRGKSAEDEARKKLVVSVREKLKEYNEALLLQSQILALEEPPKRALEAFHTWLESHGHSAMRPIVDRGDEFLDFPHDLAALAGSQRKNDPLANLLRNHFGSLCRVKTAELEPSKSGLYYFSEEKINRLADGVSVVLAAMLLVGAMTSLYYVRRETFRIGMIGGFTILFAAGLSFISRRKGEIFSATAAYAAVLVVYISGSASNAKPTV